MRNWCVMAATCLATTGAVAQTAQIAAPSVGFVVDPQTRSIRPIAGQPGAALLGKPLSLDVAVQIARFPSAPAWSLAVAADRERRPVVIQGLTSMPGVQDLGGAIGDIDFVALGENGSAAIASLKSRQMQFLSGLPATPLLSAPVDLSLVPGDLISICIRSDGTAALVAATDGTSGGIYEVTQADGSVQLIAMSQRPTAATYLNESRDLAFADAALNELILISDIHGGRNRAVLAGPVDDVAGPIAVQLTDKGLAVANAGSRNIIQYDLSAGQITGDIPLPVVPEILDPLTTHGVFVVNRVGSDPLYLYSAGQSKVWFVPRPLEKQSAATNSEKQ